MIKYLKATSSKYLGCLEWLEEYNIISRCYNMTKPDLPLDGHAIDDVFKVYMNDTGLFVSTLEYGTQYNILTGDLKGYKGAILENVGADILYKSGKKLYYFHKASGLEIDFIVRHEGKCTPVEVKSTTGNSKSLKTVLKNEDVYHLDRGYKLG